MMGPEPSVHLKTVLRIRSYCGKCWC